MESAAASATSETSSSALEAPPPKRGLHEDWTASIIGLAIFLIALFLAHQVRPEGFGWDAPRPAPLTAEQKAAKKKQESPWPVPLKGWIGKFSTWQQDPTAAFRPKPKKSQHSESRCEPGCETDAATTTLPMHQNLMHQNLMHQN